MAYGPNRTTRALRKAPSEHNPYNEKCGARKTDGSGDACKYLAGYGTDHMGVGSCKWHGGCTEAGSKRAANLMAARVMGQYFGEVDIDPHDGILWCVRMTASEIQHLTTVCADIAGDEEADDPMHFASRRIQALVAERARAMDRLSKYSKMAIDAGVAERQVAIAESYGNQLAMLLQAVFNDLELSPAQRRAAPMIAERHLMELEHGTIDTINSTAEEAE